MREINQEMIVFAIDNGHELHTRMKFLKHIDVARAMGTLRGPFYTCVNFNMGVLINMYMMNVEDYERLVRPLGFTDKQVSTMRVSGDVRQPVSVVYRGGKQQDIGPLREMDGMSAVDYIQWIYVESTAKYFVPSSVCGY